MCDELLFGTIDRLAKVAVKIVNIAFGTLDLIGLGRDGVTRSHGLCNAGSSLNRNNITLMPRLAADDLSLFTPIGYYSGAAFALHIKSRKGDEIECSDLDTTCLTALKLNAELEAVVNLIGGDVGAVAVLFSEREKNVSFRE